MILNSFVVSVTPYKQVGWWEGGMTEKDFEDHHILFRDAEKLSHIGAIFRKIPKLHYFAYGSNCEKSR